MRDVDQVHREGLVVGVHLHEHEAEVYDVHVHAPHPHHGAPGVDREEGGGRRLAHEHLLRPREGDGPREAEEADQVLKVAASHALAHPVVVGEELEVGVQETVVDAVLVARERGRKRRAALANEVNHRHDGAPVRREGGDYRGRGGVAQRHADVRGAEGPGVVAAVAAHGADEALLHEALDDADLAHGRGTREDADAREQLPRQGGVALSAREGLALLQRDHAAAEQHAAQVRRAAGGL
mmetsp:Transcript_21889/g.65315  ORF Transcript_21889/g.65315 Transcript_21889/m.65315 type:complete len:239 (+) Transcript_21889:579-1295(+)